MNQIPPATKLDETSPEKKKQTIIRFGHSSKIEPAAKVRTIVAGVFVICLCAAVTAFNEEESPKISWVFTLSLVWGSAVWLWPLGAVAYFTENRDSIKVICRLLILAMVFGLAVAFGLRQMSNIVIRRELEATKQRLDNSQDEMNTFRTHLIRLRDSGSKEEMLSAAETLKRLTQQRSSSLPYSTQ
jgi:hypothetical protein